MTTSQNLFDLYRQASAPPGQLFLEGPDGGRVTYGALWEQAARYATALKELGVVPGDRVATLAEKSVPAIYAYLGCLAAGAVYLPLNPAYSAAEIAYFLGDAEPRIVLCPPQRKGEIEPHARRAGVAHLLTMDGAGAGDLRELADAGHATGDTVPRNADDLAAILYTSGTTGRSKGAMLSHGNLSSNAFALVEAWRITAGDTLLHALPIFHTHGLFVALGTALLAGAQMRYLSAFDTEQVTAALPACTLMMGVPTYYTRLLAHPAFTRELAAHMRLFVSGSAPLSAETHREFHARTGHHILERYGMTETGMNTSNPYDGTRKPGTVGPPLAGVDLRITEPETGNALPRGEVGMIEVRGPNVFSGYWRNAEKTAEEIRADGFFITGDMGRIDGDGYVEIVGRSKDLVITGGLNVYPAEVENALDALEGVAESAVIGVPHADFGEAVVAIVAPRPGAGLDEGAIRSALQASLAKFKLPKRVLMVESLPRNTMGKVQKAALRDLHRDLFAD